MSSCVMSGTDEREVLTYEQCPWDRKHVVSIYRNIPDPVADGEWRAIPCPKPFARYRVWNGETFQAIYGNDPESPLGREVMAQTPPRSEEDTGWVLMSEPQRYALSSVFAIAPEPFRYQEAVNGWLAPYALCLLRDPDGGERGWADFANLEPGCLKDAMDRLLFLEAACREATARVEEALVAVWGAHRPALLRGVEGHADPEEIADLPAELPRSGPKSREATEGGEIRS